MTHTYTITGMTCSGCQSKVQSLLSKTPGVKAVTIDLPKGIATIEMDKHIATGSLKDALQDYPKYQLSETVQAPIIPAFEEAEKRSWLATYKPILLIFGYIAVISVIAANSSNGFSTMQSMRVFMAGFFLTFSFFKMLDLKGFAESYAMYDIVAKTWNNWGYLYAFIELGLGIAFAINFQPFITNIITAAVMGVSIIGVLQSVFNKRTIKCACLGAVFNLPMSTVTIIEDGLMIGMSAAMLVMI
ncbi:MAG: MauE/DoxX family redox-associated membrane protein [Chitinophagaceae bacterium]